MVSQLRPRRNLPRTRPLATVPGSWKARGGSDAEYYVYVGLLRTGRREGADFVFQANLSGSQFRETGDVIPDFLVFVPTLAINVQSRYYHSGDADQRAHDQYVRAILEQQGIRTAFISEDQATTDAGFWVRRALAGFVRSPLEVLST